jgi:hypothetical protein
MEKKKKKRQDKMGCIYTFGVPSKEVSISFIIAYKKEYSTIHTHTHTHTHKERCPES